MNRFHARASALDNSWVCAHRRDFVIRSRPSAPSPQRFHGDLHTALHSSRATGGSYRSRTKLGHFCVEKASGRSCLVRTSCTSAKLCDFKKTSTCFNG
ncbi:hypothetical protein ElyMa_000200600 [Elysia marginata]|uniref:Uncharacterized protein n=1 Tax=Elysia marginata TaxID=1093978 RepID=A0AAV4EX59_9GAST|nr:hypothetical protein ElyMa_000200600 [Elysia marginata]